MKLMCEKYTALYMAKTFHRELAEDLTSEVFVTAFEQFRQPGRVIDGKERYLCTAS